MFKQDNAEEVAVKRENEVEDTVSTVRIGRLKDVLSSGSSKTRSRLEAVPKEVEKEKPSEKVFEPINEAGARTVLKDYAEKLAKEQRMSLSAYLADPVISLKDNTILFVVGSKSLKNELDEEWRFIIKDFQSRSFDPAYEVSINAQEVEEYKLFTPKQQFDALSKEFPILKDFESRFGLDFDL